MDKKTQNKHGSVTFTDSQFKELQQLLQSYLKITALSGIKENEMEKNVWLLSSASYSQEEIGKILHVSQPTISRVLAGKSAKKAEEK
jgi:predicted XRE-type DNA-binding protein